MLIYELTHVFFRYEGGIVHSPKKLGLYYSYESVQNAIHYYSDQPGFCENRDAFSVRERNVLGNIVDNTVFEVVIYLRSEDYEFESEIQLGLYSDEATAQSKLIKYCEDNAALVTAQNLIVEKIVNRCIIERKEWPAGFSISE